MFLSLMGLGYRNRSYFFLMFLLREELFQMAFNFFSNKLYSSLFRALFIILVCSSIEGMCIFLRQSKKMIGFF